MNAIFSGLTMSNILVKTNEVFDALGGYLAFILGMLLAMLIIIELIHMFRKKKTMNDENSDEYNPYDEDNYYPDEDFDDDDY